jgi:hypothetical protein
MFDPSTIIVSGIQVLALVFGWVEVLKDWFNLSGKVVTAISAGLGIVFYILAAVITLVPAPWDKILEIVFQSLAFGLAASGYYKFLSARLTKS